jgi:uncharacterized protein CbrC (UPF0167 family)
MGVPEKLTLNLMDKPNLRKAMEDSPQLAKEIMSTFAFLMDEAFDTSKGTRWADLPKLFSNKLDFQSLVRGVLRGALDVRAMHEEGYEALNVEIHPLALLHPQTIMSDADEAPKKYTYAKWRKHFQLPPDVEISEEVVSEVIRKVLRYARWVNIEQLAKALDANQMTTYRGLGELAIEKLPFVPALRYQKEKFGDLHVGKMLTDIGMLDCGPLPDDYIGKCPACVAYNLVYVTDEHEGCLACNAGFTSTGG